MQAVILAGGNGTRLRPYTTDVPKPLMPIGHMPVVEVIVRQLRPADYERAVEIFQDRRAEFLGNSVCGS